MSDYSEESDDEPEGLLKKALDVDFPENFNPNSVPQNGEEYLHHVMYERKQLTVKTSVKQTSGRCIPSSDWQSKKLKDFEYFKDFVRKQNPPEPSLTILDEENFKQIIQRNSSFLQFVKYTQSVHINMLKWISKYLRSLGQGKSIEDNVGTWIFAILVMLEIPLSPSCCHTLREFIRTCLELRSKLPEDADEKLFNPLNFSICICSRYFGQLDLSD
ncbi:hypothetical protein JTB14_029874 [Gonioctena quinquepunctata]|nr:hypothetical protein JTB14_029874 [Gonioctena quinquepunctata]